MTWIAQVEMTDPLRRYVGIHLGQLLPDNGLEVVSFGEGTVKRVPENESAGPAGLKLRVDQGLALMQALNAYYGGIEDARSLRKDYDAERARVDKLLAHLTTP